MRQTPLRPHRTGLACPRCTPLTFTGLLVLVLTAATLGVAAPTAEIAAPPAPAAGASRSVGAMSLEELMSVPVMSQEVSSVSRSASTVGESPAAVFVITQEMIHRSGATTIPELLRMAPGVNVARVNSNKWVVSIRGFEQSQNVNKLLVQVDGRTVYQPLNAGVNWDSVDYPLEDIDRIEVVRGPGGTVWGANAVNGVINIITKKAKDTQGLYVNSGGGSEERGFTDFRYGGKIGDDVHYRVYGKWFERDTAFNSFGLAHDDWRGGRAGGRMDWTPGENDTFTLQGDWFLTVSGQPTTLPPPPPSRNRPIPPTDQEERGGNVLARWTHELGKDSNWQLQAYWDRFQQRRRDGVSSSSVNTYDVDFQQQFPIGDRNKFIYGLGYRLQRILQDFNLEGDVIRENLPGLTLGIPNIEEDRNVFTAFLQDEIKIVEDRFSLTVGSKFEHNEFTGFEIQPSGRLLWTPTKRQSVWAAVSRAVRTPNVGENDQEVALGQAPLFPTQVLLVPNRGLRSEEVIAYELGYRAQATDRLSFDAALFYNTYDRLIVSGPAPGASFSPFFPYPVPLEVLNGMKGETYGAEIAATWKPTDWWKLTGSYTYLKLNLHANRNLPAGLQDAAEAIEKRSPQNHFYIRSSFDIPAHVQFDLILRYVDNVPGETLRPGSGSLPAPDIKNYLTLDARLAWKPTPNLEFAIVGQNLLDDHHPETAIGVGTVITAGDPALVETPRGVYGSVTYRW